MKKLLSLALAATLLLALAACGAEPAAIPNPALVLGEKYLFDLDYEQALLQFDQAIEIDPKNPRGWLGKADALLHLNRQGDAVQTLDAGAKATRGDIRDALKAAQAEVAKSIAEGYIGLSTCYEKLGWKEIAIALIKRVCEEMPEESRLWEVLEGLVNIVENSANAYVETDKLDSSILNGYAEKEYPNGIYKGNFVNNIREGYGQMFWSDGAIYQGNWTNDQYADGTLTYADGVYYKGEFANWQRNGKGTQHWPDGSSCAGTWADDHYIDWMSFDYDLYRAYYDSAGNFVCYENIAISLFDHNLEVPLIRQVEITDKSEEDFLRKICDDAPSVDTNEAILREVVIDFKNGYMLYIQLKNENYAYIRHERTKEGRLIHMPEGLLAFVKGKLF